MSADPKSSGSKIETVTQLHRNTDHDLTKLTVKDQNNKKSVLSTTQNHPFWDATAHKWTDAKNLKPGHHLRVFKQGDVTVTRVANTTGTHEMRDLTVNELHTYYVLAGTTPVLVHNCGGGSPDYMDGAHNYTAGGHSVSYTETATAVGSDSRTLRNLANVRNDGMHDVVAHGTHDGYVDLDGEITNGGQLVHAIRANPHYREGQACRLMVCHSGVSGVGQQVADELNVPVLAPTELVGTNSLHGPGQEPLVHNGGGWVTLRPRGR